MTGRSRPGESAVCTFEALPPTKGSRAPFADSWWGRAWLRSLEETSLDSGRLSRGRTYARGGAVGPVTVAPGSAAAPVQGSRRTPYRSTVQVEQLTDQQWDRLLDMIAERAANIAALLDGEMPAGLADDAAAAGVPLLPGPRDLDPECSCPDWGYPCKHAAALCYQVARLLDRDPFVLLLLRGRGERELMDELGRRNTARASAEAAVSATTAAGADPNGSPARTGDPAGLAFASRTDLPSLPAPPPLPERAGRGPALVDSAVPEPGVDPAALELLAADTAMRAHHLLAGALGTRHADTIPPIPLTEWQDAVRFAAAHHTLEVFAHIASNCGRTPRELAAATRAWRYGGVASLDVLESPWAPPASRLERDREALRADWADGRPPRLRSWRNRWTVEGRDAQLRLGRDGLWYPYTKDQGTWWPAGPPDADPAVVLTALLET
ncbi:SWIM zinc finger family protein [Streptomyces sp. NPDC058291]|jgi:uncharacterized Zn finger protein|uniref:SWIM zinc finger family protein n=1 Tax=Streptomyces sp. NPDC058291 TaxID=3346427 RepID=UPI0036EC5CEA